MMRQLFSQSLVVASVFLFPAVSFAENLIIEGQVYNKYTGVPLVHAEVIVTNANGDLALRPTRSDSNGYYIFEILEGEIDSLPDRLFISATCVVPTRNGRVERSSGFSHPVSLIVARTERNLSIPASRRRSFSECEFIVSTQ